jgi:hypothetical protein
MLPLPFPHALETDFQFFWRIYRLQADVLGDLDGESQRLLDRSVSPEDASKQPVVLLAFKEGALRIEFDP